MKTFSVLTLQRSVHVLDDEIWSSGPCIVVFRLCFAAVEVSLHQKRIEFIQ